MVKKEILFRTIAWLIASIGLLLYAACYNQLISLIVLSIGLVLMIFMDRKYKRPSKPLKYGNIIRVTFWIMWISLFVLAILNILKERYYTAAFVAIMIIFLYVINSQNTVKNS